MEKISPSVPNQLSETLAENKTTTLSVVCCDGGANGHPAVYLNFGRRNSLQCPYCSRTFYCKHDSSLHDSEVIPRNKL
jgi:uncharacterized Zn-finger protein